MGRAASSGGFSPGFADPVFPASSQACPSVPVCALISSSYKDTSHLGLGPTLATSYYFNRLFKRFTSKNGAMLRCWG